MQIPVGSWPVLRQWRGKDKTGRGEAARSTGTDRLENRVVSADRVVK